MFKIITTSLLLAALAACGSTKSAQKSQIENPEENLLAIPLKIIDPSYPRSAACQIVSGWVSFEFALDNDGKPIDIKIKDSEPRGTFEKDAHNAIRNWVFKKEIKDAKYYYVMEFKVENDFKKSENYRALCHS